MSGPQQTKNGKKSRSFPFSTYSGPGGLRQDPCQAGESPAVARNLRAGAVRCGCCFRRMTRAGVSNR
jgi:hypothetical protein